MFDPAPPSRARRGGEPAGHAFRQNIDTFVREVVQNANDQAIDEPRIGFHLYDLRGSELAEFRRGAGWQSLEPHLAAAARSNGGELVRDFIRQADDVLRVLVVEDRGTVGLTGAEDDEASHFTALCKDTLYSHKRDESSAGGSYGLGKSVLWNFSGCATVLFNSTPSELPPGVRLGPRWLGRCELPSHKVDGDWFAGPGWFGVPTVRGAFERAESAWGAVALEHASATLMTRPDSSGTSMAIVGFRDPTADFDVELEALGKEIWRAAYRYFWPAMFIEGRQLRFEVSVGGVKIHAPEEFRTVAPLRECYKAALRGPGGELDVPGDIAVRNIEVDIPDLADGTPSPRGAVTLAVRLARPEDDKTHQGEVAQFRGPGMVIRYWPIRNVGASPRPFHAVLVAGTARTAGLPTAADAALEAFLRDAEPPGHDRWESTPKLRARYKRGYHSALKSLEDSVRRELRALLVERSDLGREGPELLRRRFPLAIGGGGAGGGPSAFEFESLSARFVERCWEIEGTVAPVFARGPWSAELRLFMVGEDGRASGAIPIQDVATNTMGGVATSHDGIVTVEMDTGDPLVFVGMSLPIVGKPSAVMLDVRGRLE